MKFAIDRDAIGTEKEVSADEFDNKPYIHSLKERFFCPECGERVFLEMADITKAAFIIKNRPNDHPSATSVLMVAQNLQ